MELFMQIDIKTLLIVCPFAFLAGLVDSIAGGGGLISLPAYVFAGLPMHFALGTNKLSSTFGTFFSAARFVKNKQVHLKSAIASVIGALMGSRIGALAALALSDIYLKYCLIILLPVIAVFILTRRDFGENTWAENLSMTKIVVLSLVSGFVIGAYDGFFGPGTGTFLILIYTSLIGFNLITASGNAKMVNLASNVSALFTFIQNGTVYFWVGLPAAIFGIIGNWIGSGLAIKKGAKVIKPVFIGVLILLFVKIGMDLVF